MCGRSARIVFWAVHPFQTVFSELPARTKKRKQKRTLLNGGNSVALVNSGRASLTTRMQKLRNSSSRILRISLFSIVSVKKCRESPMHPTRRASRSWKHIACGSKHIGGRNIRNAISVLVARPRARRHTSFLSFVCATGGGAEEGWLSEGGVVASACVRRPRRTVSHPTVPPAPSDRATHRFTPFWFIACMRCCASNLWVSG